MTVLVTGAGGFVGRPLVRRLLAEGHNVVGLDNMSAGIPDGAGKVAGDICSAAVRAEALAEPCSAIVHLATVPGGAAEADPAASRRVNLDAMYDLLLEATAAGNRPRVVYASSIAVLGDALPPGGVDDTTPLSPRMIYGGHKAMMEHAVAMLHNRGDIDAVSVRLPGIVARPPGASGLKSAFMSNIFHALRAGERFVCPVSKGATIWAQSIAQCIDNLVHALQLDARLMPVTRVVTLPALQIDMGHLAGEIAGQCGVSPSLVEYVPDAGLEAAFGAQPALETPAANRAGFAHDGDLQRLVARTLSAIASG